RFLAAAALQVDHAVEEPRLQVQHLVGVLEVARQVRVRALHHPGAEAEVAFLERDVARPLRLPPQLLALQLEQLHRAAFGDHALVALDLLLRVLRSRRREGERCRGEKSEAPHHATAVSVLLLSPWLSTQLTSILSPLAPPRRRKVNTGLRDTAWLT